MAMIQAIGSTLINNETMVWPIFSLIIIAPRKASSNIVVTMLKKKLLNN
jgi:hypothetical protein